MSKWLSEQREQALVLWAMTLWVVFFTLVSLGTSIVASLYAVRWSNLDGQDKFIICILIMVNWGTVMMAFMFRAAKRISSGELPISDTDTQLISQTNSTTKTTVVSTTPTQPNV